MNVPDAIGIERERIHETRQLLGCFGTALDKKSQHGRRNPDVTGQCLPLILIERAELVRPPPARSPSLDR